MIVTGDPSQIDLPPGQVSGLVEATELLDGVAGIAQIRFTAADVVRHPLVGRIVDAYDAARSPTRPALSSGLSRKAERRGPASRSTSSSRPATGRPAAGSDALADRAVAAAFRRTPAWRPCRTERAVGGLHRRRPHPPRSTGAIAARTSRPMFCPFRRRRRSAGRFGPLLGDIVLASRDHRARGGRPRA